MGAGIAEAAAAAERMTLRTGSAGPAHDATGVQLELTPRQSARRADLVLLLNTILATNQGQ